MLKPIENRKKNQILNLHLIKHALKKYPFFMYFCLSITEYTTIIAYYTSLKLLACTIEHYKAIIFVSLSSKKITPPYTNNEDICNCKKIEVPMQVICARAIQMYNNWEIFLSKKSLIMVHKCDGSFEIKCLIK